jgi:hypothetical protein
MVPSGMRTYRLGMLLFLLVTACGDDTEAVAAAEAIDLTGFYTWETYANQLDGCDAPEESTAHPGFLYAHKEGTDWLFEGCTTAEASDCNNFAEFDPSTPIDTPTADGWSGDLYWDFSDHDQCALRHDMSSAVLREGALSLETRTFILVDGSETNCTAARAEERSAELPCTRMTIATGTLVE